MACKYGLAWCEVVETLFHRLDVGHAKSVKHFRNDLMDELGERHDGLQHNDSILSHIEIFLKLGSQFSESGEHLVEDRYVNGEAAGHVIAAS